MTAPDAVRLPHWIQGLALTVAWVAVWGLGHLGEFATHASVWYPPAALSFASLVVLGARVVPYLVLGCLGGTAWSVSIYQIEASWVTLAAFGLTNAAAHIGCYGAGAYALRHYAAKHRQQLPNVIIAFLVIATGSSALATIGVVAALMAFELLGPDEPIATALAFWIGDFVSVVVLGPLFAALLLRAVKRTELWNDARDFFSRDRLRGSLGFKLGVTVLSLLLAMGIADRIQSHEAAFLVFFVLIPQLWLTYTESPLATAISLALISFLIIVLLGVLQLEQFVFVYQLAIAIIATTAYFGLAIPLLESANRQLRQRLMFDPLTGAAARSYLREKAEQLMQASDAPSDSSLALIDLDHFKRINDQHGHGLGDQALIALVESLRSHLRGRDVVARFGGDEFMVLLVGCARDEALALMTQALESIRLVRLAGKVQFTASVGVATRLPGESFDAWLERADQALYDAKKAGRNCVR